MRKIRQCPLCAHDVTMFVRTRINAVGNPRIQLAVKCDNFRCGIEKTAELSPGTPMNTFEEVVDKLIREWNTRPEADELEEKYQKAIGVIAASDCSDCRNNCGERKNNCENCDE